MRDIPERFLVVILGDATLRALMGSDVDPNDSRVYRYYNSDAYIDDYRRAFITWALIATPPLQGGVEDPVYSFVIWGRDIDIVEQVRDRLVFLFGKKGIATDTGRQLYGQKVHEQDSYQEQPNYDGKTLHFKFGYLALSAVS